MEETRMPLIGDKFPTLEVQTTHGKLKLPDVNTAKKRLKEYDGYDWWFCHKKV